MSSIEQTCTYNIDVNVEDAMRSVGRLSAQLYGLARIFRRLGLPEESQALLMRIQQIISAVTMLRIALLTLELTSPYGLVIGAFTLAGTAMTVGDTLYEATRGF